VPKDVRTVQVHKFGNATLVKALYIQRLIKNGQKMKKRSIDVLTHAQLTGLTMSMILTKVCGVLINANGHTGLTTLK
jgi:hypothetical protein